MRVVQLDEDTLHVRRLTHKVGSQLIDRPIDRRAIRDHERHPDRALKRVQDLEVGNPEPVAFGNLGDVSAECRIARRAEHLTQPHCPDPEVRGDCVPSLAWVYRGTELRPSRPEPIVA